MRNINAPEPGGRTPAPGPLALAQAFLNTRDREAGRDWFQDPESTREWLVAKRLLAPDSQVSDADHRLVLQVREALHELALANRGGRVDAPAMQTLNRVAGGLRLVLCFEEKGPAELVPLLGGVDGSVGRILSLVYTAMVTGSWARLKACQRDTCQWVFYDQSKNRSSSWCAMSVCGNREKAKSYRRRRAARHVAIEDSS